jgi:hypothetical protein
MATVPGLFLEGGLTMPPGIFKDAAKKNGVAILSYAPNESLAQMIVDAWVDDEFRKQLVDRDPKGNVTDLAKKSARAALAARGIYLNAAIVITEDEYDSGHVLHHNDAVAFVLPNKTRVTPRPGQSLLETARFLMAATPNGI